VAAFVAARRGLAAAGLPAQPHQAFPRPDRVLAGARRPARTGWV